jgi:predicted PurR-regulated permease PerM
MLGFDTRVAKAAWTVSLLALLFFVIYTIASTIMVVVFAIFFSYLVYPLIALLERRGPKKMPRTASIAIVFVVVILIVAVGGSLFGVQIQDQAVKLAGQLPQLLHSDNVSARIPLPHFMEPLRAKIVDFVQGQMESGSDKAMPLARNLGLSVMHAASNLIYIVLIPILSFLLIKEAPSMRKAFLSWMEPAHKRLWTAIVDDLDLLLSRYVRALLFLSIATLIFYGIAFSLMRVPYALLLAAIAAVLEFIPFAGPLAAVAIALAVAAFSGYAHLLGLLGFIVVYRLFQDYVLSPYLMSEGVSVSPFLVIIGLLAGDQLGGVAGIFISVPFMAAFKIILTRARAASEHQPLPAAQDATSYKRAADKIQLGSEE